MKICIMEHVWYYARDDQESGPFTEPQMRMLVAAGKVRQHDLVWKEGMSDWVSATDAPGLALAPVAPPAPPLSNPGSQRDVVAIPDSNVGLLDRDHSAQHQTSRVARESSRTLRSLAYLLIAIGFIGAFGAKGYESLASRNVARLEAIVALQNSSFEAEWSKKREALQAEEDAIQTSGQFDIANRQRLNEISAQLAQLTLSEHEKRTEMERGVWREQRQAAEAAKHSDRISAFWRQLIFLAAASVFCAGLLAMGLIGEGAERAVSLLILAVLAYAVFIGGSAWS